MKKAMVIEIYFLCFVILISGCSGLEPAPDTQDGLPEPGATEQNTPPPQANGPVSPVKPDPSPGSNTASQEKPDPTDSSGQSPTDQLPEDPEPDDVLVFEIYGPGSYKVGTDIPAGIYMAANDGSSVSKVTVKDSPEPKPEKPRYYWRLK